VARVGLVGGLGPQATLDYYRRLIKAWECEDPLSSPLIVIDSVDDKIALRLAEHDRPALTEYILESLHRLHGAGVSFGAITSNTSHLVFDRVAPRSPIPLISIVDVCMAEARRLNLKRLAIFGTRFVMEARLYPAAAQPQRIQIVVPPEPQRTWLHERYVGELVKGDFRDETRSGVIAMAERLRNAKGIDGVILGGTELPLLMRDPTIADVPVLDTTGLHVAAIMRRLRE
jgi:aspartate racemase